MQNFNRILIGVAFSPNIKANILEAMRLALMFDAELYITHIGIETSKKKSDINQIISSVAIKPKKIEILFQAGKPVQTILQIVNSNDIDLLILGALQRENLFTFYMGSIARKLTRKASCSVLLLIKQSEERIPCKHIVVNGLKEDKTEDTIHTSFVVAKSLDCKKITIVEEINQQELAVTASDDINLRKLNIAKAKMKKKEALRVNDLLTKIPSELKEGIDILNQSIFGRRGYSIGHYARVVRADLLVMNAPKTTKLIDRIFPHDIEYILSELPSDTLIVKS